MVESSPLPPGTERHPPDEVGRFVAAVFGALGIPDHDARLCAEVLVAADVRGIRSHGVARLPYFAVRIEQGMINPRPEMRLEQRTATTATLDADNGLGTVASERAMDAALAMAAEHGSGFVTVSRSNHFGFAGFWSERAMRRGCVGLAMSSSGRRVTPTFGAESLLGTNPLSVAVPGGPGGTDFLLDMATAAVAVGKIETALREERDLPPGWVAESGAPPHLDERGVLTYAAPLLPLGGEGDTTGGHKGYGLGLLVELLCGALAGSPLADRVAGADGSAPAGFGHFMGALRVDGFRDEDGAYGDMAATFALLRNAAKAPGHDRIFIHGEPETLAAADNERLGIPLTPALLEQMRALNSRLALGFPL